MKPSKYLVSCLLLVLVIYGGQIVYGHFAAKPIVTSGVTAITPKPIFSQAPSVASPSPSPTPTHNAIVPRLSLEQIFSSDHSWTADLPKDKTRTLVATGDILTARSVNAKAVRDNNFTRLFAKTVDVLKGADVTLINLETPLTPNCPITNEGMSFCGDVRNVEGLVFAGVDVASLANNHTGNHGAAGVNSTVSVLEGAGILPMGTTSNGTAYKEVDGSRFAFLGYNDVGTQPGVKAAVEATVKAEVAEAKDQADIVVVMFHWGAEYVTQPNERQRNLARLAIDAGADLIVSNHPHWIQPIEIYNGKMIAYALGNFIFDQTWSQKTQEGVVARFTYYENELIDLEFLPVQISSLGQPTFMTGANKERILNEMKTASQKLAE
jgi:poly-gamma-glutamate synthesis protein (capsule biosynthesis protein)